MPKSEREAALVAAPILLGGCIAFAPPGGLGRPTATPIPLPSPDRLLYQIRRQFRSHRPPPPYVTYTLVRKQTLDDGYPDLLNSYTYHIWCRTYDRAALGRRVYHGSARGTLEFLRPVLQRTVGSGPADGRSLRTGARSSARQPARVRADARADRKPSAAHRERDRARRIRLSRHAHRDEGDLIHVSLHAAARSGSQSSARALRR